MQKMRSQAKNIIRQTDSGGTTIRIRPSTPKVNLMQKPSRVKQSIPVMSSAQNLDIEKLQQKVMSSGTASKISVNSSINKSPQRRMKITKVKKRDLSNGSRNSRHEKENNVFDS